MVKQQIKMYFQSNPVPVVLLVLSAMFKDSEVVSEAVEILRREC